MIGHRRAPSRVPDVTHVTLSPKPFAFCKQSKIGGGNSLGTRLQNHRSSQDRSRNLSLTISTTFPGSIIGTLSRSFPGSILLGNIPGINRWNVLENASIRSCDRASIQTSRRENEKQSSLHKQLVFVAFGIP